MTIDRAATAIRALCRGERIHAAAIVAGLNPAAVRRLGTAIGLVEHPDGTMRYRPPIGRGKGGQARAAEADYPAAVVRAWARERGIPCPPRGRYLPPDVVAAWRKSQAQP